MARSLNRVQLIGNLTRDPELRYTPNGTAVCSFSIATNRTWKTEAGEKREEADFHRIVAWNKLAEICSQFLVKGRKVYVEGRLSTRNWNAKDGTQRTTTEVVISDMILLDSRREPIEPEAKSDLAGEAAEPAVTPEPVDNETAKEEERISKKSGHSAKQEPAKKDKSEEKAPAEEVAPDDIPF